MNSRRHLLKSLLLAGLGVGIPAHAFAGKRTQPKPRFAENVREKTNLLNIESGRWKWIVAHHSAIRNGNALIYDRAHRARGMENGLAYHFVIGNGIDSGDGEIEIGGRWLKQLKGGHVHREEINEVGIGICLVGNFEETNPTPKQLAAFRELMGDLRTSVTGTTVQFAVHREIIPAAHFVPVEIFPARKCTASTAHDG